MNEKNSMMIPEEVIINKILNIRGLKVMIDNDLAELYGLPTKRLNEQVKRNQERFPDDFMFQLRPEETEFLRSQSATSKTGRGGRRYLPYVFTEHGAIMAANVLNSPRAIQASVLVVRAFVRLREIVAPHKELADKLAELEKRISGQDENIQTLFQAIRELMTGPDSPRRQIGFHVKEKAGIYKTKKTRRGS